MTSSQATFTRLFGGYAQALAVAGLVAGEAGAAAVVRGGIVRAAGYFVSDDQIHAALREVAGVVGRSPRSGEYTAGRARIIEESKQAGRPRSLPSYAVIQRRHGNWDAALQAAGLEPLGGRHTRSNARGPRGERAAPQISDETILANIREAYAELGDPFVVEAYKAWRTRTLTEERERGVRRRIASHHTIWKRFGSWEAACRRALPDAFGDQSTSEPEK